jgi:hypothetical protein
MPPSTKFINKEVLVIAVSGDVGAVKLEVYRAVPFRIRTPDKYEEVTIKTPAGFAPIPSDADELKRVAVKECELTKAPL